MSALVLATQRTAQPQGPIAVDYGNPLARGLVFAINPAAGGVNLARSNWPSVNTELVRSTSASVLISSGAANYSQSINNANGLTLFSILRSRDASQYLFGDGERAILSARNASNQGWTWSRAQAADIGGGKGNATRQAFTLNGVAAYSEANSTIESFADVPVALRYNKSTGVISWFSNGRKSSSDTNGSTGGTVGGDLVFRRQGPYANNLLPYIDKTGLTLVFERALSDAEISSISANPWQLFKPVERRIWVPASAGDPTYATASASSAFSVRGFASASQASAWSVRAHVGAAGAADWSVRNHAAQTAPASYTIRNFAGASGAASFSARNHASASASAAFSVLAAGLVSATASAAWTVRNHTTASRSAAASVRNFASASAASAFSVLTSGLVTASRSAAWSVRNAVTASAPAAFSVRNYASRLQAGAWSVRSAVDSTRSAAWSVTAYVWHTTGAAWSVDGDGDTSTWPAKAVRAVVPATFGRLVVPAIDATATVPAAETRAIVPATGDDMQPIKTIEQYRQDRATYKIDFDAKFLASTGDTAQTLKAVGHDPGISVTSQVPVGGPLSSGVVHVAVDDPEATGDYKVWAQIRTVGGDERTGVIVVRVEDL